MLVPCFMYAYAVRNRNLGIIKVASVMALLGIILNRLNVTVIAYRWYDVHKYHPSWQEIVVTLVVVFTEIWIFWWIVTRMPVFEKK